MKNCVELADLSAQLASFNDKILALADKIGLTLTRLDCDHISLRCHSLETATRWQQGLMKCAELISQKEINGRPICLFSLSQPLLVAGFAIDCVELPYPNGKRYSQEGWEHIELVLPGDPETLHQRALERLSDQGLIRSDIKVKCSKPKGEGEALPNPTLAITDGEVTIKFHPYSIRDIVSSEQ